MVKKYLALDLGTKTLGIAYNDCLGFVYGLETFHFPKGKYHLALNRVIELCEQRGVSDLVIGLPLHLSGGKSEMSETCLKFKEDLLSLNNNLSIEMVDERLSTVTAHKNISERGMNHQQRKNTVDRIAACIILDTYLKMKGN